MRTLVVLIFFPRRPLAGDALRAAGEKAKTTFSSMRFSIFIFPPQKRCPE